MTPEAWRQVSDCLDRLLDLDAAGGEAYLRDLRATRPELSAEVESLWRQQATRTYLEAPPADALPPPAAGPTVAGGYELLGEIARGGMGAVYEARDPVLGRTLAVKLLLPELRHLPEARERLTREAGITGRLQHPGIPPVHELGRLADGTPFFAMKLIRGRTLAALLADAPADPADPVATFEQVCRTLAYAHAQGVIHRDLKPGNVMVGAFGEVQVMDWGLAKVMRNREVGSRNEEADPVPPSDIAVPTSDVTLAGDVRGTPAYMAPEQARGEAADERADVFGLGGILVALLTRRATFTGSASDMLRQARGGETGPAVERVAAAGADAELVAVARRCLAPRPEDRYRHAGEAADAVAAYRRGARERLEAAERGRHAADTQAREERRRRRVVIGFGAALLAAVSAGLGVAVWLGLVAEGRRQAAETAEKKVTDAQARTEETAAQARKAVRDGFILATEDPEFQKHGMQDARKLLLDRALAFYREFTALRGNDPALREEVADAHDRIGVILADRGEHRDALAEYAEAVRLTAPPTAEQPDEPRPHSLRAAALLHQADAEQALGRADAAADSLRAARRELAPVLAAEPHDPDWLHLDARVHTGLGGWLYVQGKLDDAAAEFQAALDRAAEPDGTAKPRTVSAVMTTVAALVGLGHVRKDQRRPVDALALYRRAERPLNDLHETHPGPYSTAELARLYGSIAIAEGERGEHDLEMTAQRTAIGFREQLVAANPRVPDYRLELAKSLFNLALALGPAQPEGKRSLERAVGLAEGLVTEFPDVVLYRHHAAAVRIALSRVLRQNPKEVDKAEDQLTAAGKHLDDLARRKAMTPLFRQTLADWESESGQVGWARERPAEAAKHYEAAGRVYRGLIADGFQVENCRYAVARLQSNLAFAAAKAGDYDTALRAQSAGVEQLTDLLKLRKDDRTIRASLDRATANMVSFGDDWLTRDLPAPGTKTIENRADYHQARFARWHGWCEEYPAVDGFRRQAVAEAVATAAQYGTRLDPAEAIGADARRVALDRIAAALAQARDSGLADAKPLEAEPGLAHFRALPEYREFLKTLK